MIFSPCQCEWGHNNALRACVIFHFTLHISIYISVVIVVVIVNKSYEIRTMGTESVRTMVICVRNNPISLTFLFPTTCPDIKFKEKRWTRKKSSKWRNYFFFSLFALLSSFRCLFWWKEPQKSQLNSVNSFIMLLWVMTLGVIVHNHWHGTNEKQRRKNSVGDVDNDDRMEKM